jgi:hypothetical protein
VHRVAGAPGGARWGVFGQHRHDRDQQPGVGERHQGSVLAPLAGREGAQRGGGPGVGLATVGGITEPACDQLGHGSTLVGHLRWRAASILGVLTQAG